MSGIADAMTQVMNGLSGEQPASNGTVPQHALINKPSSNEPNQPSQNVSSIGDPGDPGGGVMPDPGLPGPSPVVPAPVVPPVVAPAAPTASLDAGVLLSDKNAKTNIKNTSSSDIDQFIKSLSPKSYDYKDGKNGTHTEAGLMAQDLQKSNIGKTVVMKTNKGLAVNSTKLAPILATIMSSKFQEMDRKLQEALDNRFKKGKK